ncbi:Protein MICRORCHIDIA 6 [Orobanche gracilis]
MSSANLHGNHGLGELGVKAVKLEQDISGRPLQQNDDSKLKLTSHEESNLLNGRSTILKTPNNGARFLDQERPSIGDPSYCSTSSICPAPICRQFWKAGNYDDRLSIKPTYRNCTGYLRIHPKFLHSNATSHKWAFGAMAELLDNAVDEIQRGATFVIVDKTSTPRDGNPALLIQDDGGGMDPEAMRRCLSFGFSDKKSKDAIGRYGNGFKTSSMRLGADVVVFSRCRRARRLTQSVGLLSYTFLMQTRHDRIVVPMVDYEFDTDSGTWKTLHSEQHLNSNLSILLQWSPVATEAELMEQCDGIGAHGTKIIIYNLWHNGEGKMELDFESDSEDICLSSKDNNTAKSASRKDINEEHLANRIQRSLRMMIISNCTLIPTISGSAYLSVLYLRAPENFCILLRGRVVEYHNIANDLKYPEFILYRPQNVEGSVTTTIGFLKEAPAVNIHGFNVYHKNRLILPFWHVVTFSDSRGRGVVGVLEANFIEPTHNKQEFEKTPVFQKLETRLKEMTQEYWDYHCGLIGYQVKKAPRPTMMIPHVASNSRLRNSIYQPVVLGNDSGAIGSKASFAAGSSRREVSALSNHVAAKSGRSVSSIYQNSPGNAFKRKGHDHVVEFGRVKRAVVGSKKSSNASSENPQHAVESAKPLEDQEAANMIEDNRNLHAQCQEFEKMDEELDLKITRLTEAVREARRERVRVLLELKLLEKVKRENVDIRPV